MKNTLTRIVLALVVLAVVVIGALYAVSQTGTPPTSIATPARLVADAATIERGRYLAVAGDCAACHTAPGGQAFAGGLPLASPIGTIYSSNITPDKATGIGNDTLDDFDRALRHGMRRDGDTLYPAMPWPSYAKLSADDVAALYAYFHDAVPAVAAATHDSGIPWPLSMRWPLALWRKAFGPEVVPFDASHYASAEIARGAYLVEGPGHCGTCHTPRALTLQEKALDDSSPLYLAGGQVIDGWFAVNLRGDAGDGLGGWSAADIVSTLKTGRNPVRAVVGSPMADVVVHSTQDMTDADRSAIAAYLKTLPASTSPATTFAADDSTTKALRAGAGQGRGAEVYVDNCAACHLSSGQGEAHAFPAIAGNSSVLASDPSTLIRLVLGGGAMPGTHAAPSALGMPAFGWRLSDEDTAQVLTFIRASWGNHAPAVDASQVAKIRATIPAKQASND